MQLFQQLLKNRRFILYNFYIQKDRFLNFSIKYNIRYDKIKLSLLENYYWNYLFIL